MFVCSIRVVPAILMLALGAAACTPVAVTSSSGLRAETRYPAPNDRIFRADGLSFPTRRARDAYLQQVEVERSRNQSAYVHRLTRQTRREARLAREERRLLELERARLRAERAEAQAQRARRQAERATRRARASTIEAQTRTRARQAEIDTDRAVRDAHRAQRQARRAQERANTVAARANRVDRLAPRPGLAPATKAKIRKYGQYRRKGENEPAFVMRIARAERLSVREGRSVAHWLNDKNRRRQGASER